MRGFHPIPAPSDYTYFNTCSISQFHNLSLSYHSEMTSCDKSCLESALWVLMKWGLSEQYADHLWLHLWRDEWVMSKSNMQRWDVQDFWMIRMWNTQVSAVFDEAWYFVLREEQWSAALPRSCVFLPVFLSFCHDGLLQAPLWYSWFYLQPVEVPMQHQLCLYAPQ